MELAFANAYNILVHPFYITRLIQKASKVLVSHYFALFLFRLDLRYFHSNELTLNTNK